MHSAKRYQDVAPFKAAAAVQIDHPSFPVDQ